MAVSNSVEQLRGDYSAEIAEGHRGRGFRENILHTITQPRVLAPAITAAVITAAFAPGVIEGAVRGLPLPEAAIYGFIDSLLTVTRPDVKLAEISEDIRRAVPLFTTELQAIITSSVTTALAVNGWQSFRRSSERREAAILSGTAKIKRPSEQMFLFGGEGSQVANILTATLGDQALPIFETAEAAELIINRFQRGKNNLFPIDKNGYPQIPFFLDLGVDGSVGYQNSLGWRKLSLDERNLLHTATGDKVLLTYGFGETNKEVLPLKDELEQDLSVAELLAGTNQLELLARNRGINIDKIVRVYLGNARLRRQRHSGFGLQDLTDRELARGVDIFVDTRAPIIAAIRRILGDQQRFAFETSRLDYVRELGQAASVFGLKIYDEQETLPLRSPTTALVHEDSVSDTLEVSTFLQRSGIYGRVVALTPTLWSHERAEEKGLESLCVPLVYADLMLEIRKRIRAGESPSAIQEDFDKRFPYQS